MTSSSCVTPRSNAMRSTLLSFSLRMSSLIVALILCIGVSATTRSLPTMPTAMEGCCWWSVVSTATSPAMLRATSG